MGTVNQQQLQTQDDTRQSALETLRERVAAVEVRSQQQYITASQVLVDLKAYLKDCERKRDDEIEPLKNELDQKKNAWAVFIAPAKALVQTVSDRLTTYKEEERRQAQVEQDRINAENRRKAQEKADAERKEAEKIAAENKKKRIAEINAQLKRGDIGKREAARLLKEAGAAAEAAVQDAAARAEETAATPAQVAVKPNIPTVAAVKNQVYFYAEVNSPEAILEEFDAAVSRIHIARFTHDKEAEREAMQRGLFLRQFIMVNEQAVGKFARDTKDNQKASEMLPGVRFYSKG